MIPLIERGIRGFQKQEKKEHLSGGQRYARQIADVYGVHAERNDSGQMEVRISGNASFLVQDQEGNISIHYVTTERNPRIGWNVSLQGVTASLSGETHGKKWIHFQGQSRHPTTFTEDAYYLELQPTVLQVVKGEQPILERLPESVAVAA